MRDKHKFPSGFSNPVAQPAELVQSNEWQVLNRSWWESNPMRYDWTSPIVAPQYSRKFFEEIDRRFFSSAAHYLRSQRLPFDELIPFRALPKFDVLEIGVGNGTHAQLIAPHCHTYTGIDLTRYAVGSTSQRFHVFGLPGSVVQMDAENMAFPNNSFDFIWSWGVIHHSSNTEQILQEMRRVLRPGGRAVVMVYHRSPFYYYFFNGLFRGIMQGQFFKTPSLHKLVQLNTDGALARFYKVKEWRLLAERHLIVEKIQIKGQKPELFPMPASQLKETLMRVTPDKLCRLFLNSLRQGSFLICSLRRA